jgi:hypothetical protein
MQLMGTKHYPVRMFSDGMDYSLRDTYLSIWSGMQLFEKSLLVLQEIL